MSGACDLIIYAAMGNLYKPLQWDFHLYWSSDTTFLSIALPEDTASGVFRASENLFFPRPLCLTNSFVADIKVSHIRLPVRIRCQVQRASLLQQHLQILLC